VEGFADPANYDTTPSSLSRPSGQASVTGQGSILNTGTGIRSDLNAGSPLNGVGNPQQADVNYNNGQIIAQDGPGLNSGLVPSARNTLPGQVRPQPNTIGGQSGIFPTPPLP